MIRHALAEGFLLVRQRGVVSLTLALALAVPICLAGLTLTILQWLGPLVELADDKRTQAVLLHPRMDDAQRRQWIAQQEAEHPDWQLDVVPPEELAGRLIHWFPYLTDLLRDGGGSLLPPLVEVTPVDPQGFDELQSSPAVIAIGPRSSIQQVATQTVRRLGWLFSIVSAILLAAVVLLAVVWVHLELYRHADEITIMRLVGATEAAIRGPFLVAVFIPGALAGVVAVLGTTALAALGSRLTAVLGLPSLDVSVAVIALEVSLACILPLAAAALTLRRHAVLEIEG